MTKVCKKFDLFFDDASASAADSDSDEQTPQTVGGSAYSAPPLTLELSARSLSMVGSAGYVEPVFERYESMSDEV